MEEAAGEGGRSWVRRQGGGNGERLLLLEGGESLGIIQGLMGNRIPTASQEERWRGL